MLSEQGGGQMATNLHTINSGAKKNKTVCTIFVWTHSMCFNAMQGKKVKITLVISTMTTTIKIHLFKE